MVKTWKWQQYIVTQTYFINPRKVLLLPLDACSKFKLYTNQTKHITWMCRVNCMFQIYQAGIPSGRYQVNVQSGQSSLNAKQVVYYTKKSINKTMPP